MEPLDSQEIPKIKRNITIEVLPFILYLLSLIIGASISNDSIGLGSNWIIINPVRWFRSNVIELVNLVLSTLLSFFSGIVTLFILTEYRVVPKLKK